MVIQGRPGGPLVPPDFFPRQPNPPPITPNYSAAGVHFAGSILTKGPTYLKCNSLNTINPKNGNGADNGNYSFSFWAQTLNSTINNGCTLFVHDPGSFDAGGHLISGAYSPSFQTSGNASSSKIQFADVGAISGNGIGSVFWPVTPNAFAVNDGLWHHYLGSVFVNAAHGSKKAVLYIDDILVNPSNLTDVGGSVIPVIAGKTFYFGDDFINIPLNPPFTGFGPDVNVADVWISPNTGLLDQTDNFNSINPGVRRRFTVVLDGNFLIPLNPLNFPDAAILFSGNAATFGANLGFGGNFGLVGSLSDVTGPSRIAI